jgi:hypothetical protein
MSPTPILDALCGPYGRAEIVLDWTGPSAYVPATGLSHSERHRQLAAQDDDFTRALANDGWKRRHAERVRRSYEEAIAA